MSYDIAKTKFAWLKWHKRCDFRTDAKVFSKLVVISLYLSN